MTFHIFWILSIVNKTLLIFTLHLNIKQFIKQYRFRRARREANWQLYLDHLLCAYCNCVREMHFKCSFISIKFIFKTT